MYVPLPDYSARRQLIESIIVDGAHLDFELLAELTNGYSGDDIVHALRSAGMRNVMAGRARFEMSDLIDAFKRTPPSSDPRDIARIEAFYQSTQRRGITDVLH